jgi:hydroxymethylglutaryl-CoA synthase
LDLITRKLSNKSYKQKVDPFTKVSKLVGNCYTASVYLNLATLVNEKGSQLQLKNTKTLVFSYGSGSMASMFTIDTTTNLSHFSLNKIQQTLQLNQRLEKRFQKTPKEFETHM